MPEGTVSPLQPLREKKALITGGAGFIGSHLADRLVTGLAQALQACAAWHRTPEVVVRESEPPQLSAALTAAMTAH